MLTAVSSEVNVVTVIVAVSSICFMNTLYQFESDYCTFFMNLFIVQLSPTNWYDLIMDQIQSKTHLILQAIANAKDGLRFGEIQKVLWEMDHPDTPFTRKNRGWWCSNLLGTTLAKLDSLYGHQGILHTFCVKENGKWKRNDVEIPQHPWTIINNECRIATNRYKRK